MANLDIDEESFDRCTEKILHAMNGEHALTSILASMRAGCIASNYTIKEGNTRAKKIESFLSLASTIANIYID